MERNMENIYISLISMFTMWTLCTHMKCEGKCNGDMGMGHLSLIIGGTFMD